MRVAFDDMDRKFRQPPMLRLEPMSAGDNCVHPQCKGRMSWQPIVNEDDDTCQLACDECGWTQSRFE